MVGPKSLELELPRDRGAPSQARRRLEKEYAVTLDSSELDAARLLASELVSNAVVHGRGQITLRTALDDNGFLLEVIDEGSGFEQVLDHHDLDRTGGRGLQIVEAVASRWGVHEGTTHVWFELERPGPRLGADSKPKLAE